MNSFDTNFYGRIMNLKTTNPALQVFISVGGCAQGGAAWSQMASTPATRNTFIQSAIQLMTTYGFDGIDLDVRTQKHRDIQP
jgi:chitinase